MIDVHYTPPEEGYHPPYYRAASAVTLTCRVVGAIGRIRFRWSSTCSSCFVPGGYYYSYSSHSRSQSFLRSRDAGTHTCTAYQSSRGISGSASTVMNIVGECSLVFKLGLSLSVHVCNTGLAAGFQINNCQCSMHVYAITVVPINMLSHVLPFYTPPWPHMMVITSITTRPLPLAVYMTD